MIKRLARILITATLAACFIPTIATSAAIATPDTLTISSVNAYRNCLETGDQLYLITGTIEYAAPPTEGTAYDLFLIRLMDGAVELKATEPYAYFDDGYDYFVTGLYFTAEEVTTLAMGWGAGEGYTVRLEGNPALTWTDSPIPSYTFAGIADWYDGTTLAATKLQLTLKVRTLAIATEATWAITLTEFSGGVRKFNAAGEDYFTYSIPNLRQLCPSLFSTSESTPNFPDKGLVNIGYTGGDDTAQVTYTGEWAAQTFITGASFDIAGVYFKYFRVGVPSDLTVSIRATLAGEPTGADLASGTFDATGGTLQPPGVIPLGSWDSVVFSTAYTLAANTQYAIVFRSPAGDVNHAVGLRMDSAGTYSGGQVWTSANSGAAWAAQAAKDIVFSIMADEANNLTWLQQWEGRLLGTPFDFTNNFLNWPRMLFGTVVWLIASIAIAGLVLRRPTINNFKWGMPIVGVMMTIGAPIGFVYAIIGISIPVLILLGALYAVLKPAH